MKVCKLCGSTYGDRVDFCFKDGQPLTVAEEPSAVEAPSRSGGRPGLGDMLDVPEPAFLRRSADPTALPDPVDLPDPTALPGPVDPASAPDPFDAPAVDDAAALPDVPDEELPGPAPIEPPELDVPVVPPAGDPNSTLGAFDDDAAPAADEPFPASLDSTLGALDDAPEPPRSLFGGDDLPGPTSLDEDLDDDAMADLARTLGGSAGGAVAPEDAETLHDPVDTGAPVLADLVEDAPQPVSSDAPAEEVIGLDHRDQEIAFVEDEQPRKSDNRLVFGLMAAAVLLAALAGIWLVASGDAPADDPMANKPEERAAPVMAAPGAAQTPPPVQPEEPVVEEPAVEEPVAEEPAVEEPGAEEPVAEEPVAAAPAPAATPAPAAQAAAAPRAATTTAPAAAAASRTATQAAAAEPTAAVSGGADPWQTEVSSGRLTINTIPSGATVYVDNRQYGPSPLSAELGYGVHTIRVELGGYSTEARTIDVQVPEMAVPFELKPLVVTGTVNVFGPTGAAVYVDGAQVGKIPTSVKLTEGAHSFRVETADGSSFTRNQDIRFNGGSTVSVTLSP